MTAAPTDDDLRAVAAACGSGPESLRLLGEGATAWVYGLDDRRVVRFPRGDEGVDALRREAGVLPLLESRSIPAPRLLAIGDAPVLHSVLSLVAGAPLTDAAAPPPVLRAAARHLAALHQLALDAPPPYVRVLPADDDNGRAAIPQLVANGMLSQAQADWASEVLDALERDGGVETASLLHGDLRPNNLMATGGRLRGIIDWGDASFGPPAVDFGCLPPTLLPGFLAAYRRAWPDTPVTPRSVLRIQLGWALSAVGREPRPHEHTWSAPPAGRLVELLRLAADPPRGWREPLAPLRGR